LLCERAARITLPGTLVVPAGFAAIIVVGQVLTLADATAELATPTVVALAAAGGALSLGRIRASRIDPWAVGCATLAFAAFGAPVLLSGEATFAGYIKLDDTATWMAFTDHTMEHGRSLAGLPPSSYEAALDLNLGKGYPTGILAPYGIGATIVGQDVAWLFQPYQALLAAMLALCLVAIAAPLLRSRPLSALVALMGSQAALLLGYAMWGGVKEVAAAYLVALVAALAPLALRPGPEGVRAAAAIAVAAAALLGTLSPGALLWLLPLLLPVAVALARRLGPRASLTRGVACVGVGAILVVPAIMAGGSLPLSAKSLRSGESLGNLLGPVSPLQAFGIWPSGDFRLDPDSWALTLIAIAIVAAGGIAALWLARRSRAWGVLVYVAGTAAGAAAIWALGSPWVDGKALATLSPALLFAGAAGLAAVARSSHPALGAVALGAIAAGVLWSNALAYREVNLAPRDQLAELELIGERIAGEGPTLMTEYQPYGVRHFLRDAEPEGASELRRREVPLRGGGTAKKGRWADTDELATEGLFVYRTLVLRRSPSQSRPPSPYELTWRGTYYEVWQRPHPTGREVVARLPLGGQAQPSGTATCPDVLRLARRAGPGGRLVAARRPRVSVVPLTDTSHPAGWEDAHYGPATLIPRGGGSIAAEVSVPVGGGYTVWVGGSVRGTVELVVDGEPVGEARHRLNNPGQYISLGESELAPGPHRLVLELGGPDVHPGSGGQPLPLGPLVLSRAEAPDARLTTLARQRARRLCGKNWDWIEAVA
jgi:hypothetical protein